MIKILLLKIVAFIAPLFFVFCSTEGDNKQVEIPDAITQSSEDLNRTNASLLPPQDSTYTVYGYVNGLKGYIVQYNKNLYRGGNLLSDSGGLLLKKHGIRTIISITPDDFQKRIARRYALTYIEFPFDYSKLPQSKLMHFLDIIKNSQGPLFIHCHGGNQRAGNLCAIYRMKVEGWPFERALIEYGKLGGKIREDYVMLEKCAAILSNNTAYN